MNLRNRLILGIFSLLLAACGTPGLAQSIAPVAQQSTAMPAALVGAPANATPTATPFMPIPVTPTPAPTEIPPTPAISPTPTFAPLATSTPAAADWLDGIDPSFYGAGTTSAMGLFDQPDNQINILLLGSDKRPNGTAYRTDVILLLTLNTELGTVNVTSFPRDLYVFIPGWGMDRINTAHFRGDFELVSLMFEYNFGVRPDHYAMVSFSGFKQIIDLLGGIDVQVEKELTDHRTGYNWYTVSPGTMHMDADTALWYVRSRKTTNDFDRTRRQQEVLQGIFMRLVSLDALSKAPEIYDNLDEFVKTDLTFADMVPLLPLAGKVATDGSNINRYAINSEHVTSWLTYEGAQVLLPNQDLVRSVMLEALNIP
ncbi:MAG: LCP family protein [Anaerolineales bacterium]|nr:LCP family protein [Anaerolineales bacterium]